jgi:hypothetical protein
MNSTARTLPLAGYLVEPTETVSALEEATKGRAVTRKEIIIRFLISKEA